MTQTLWPFPHDEAYWLSFCGHPELPAGFNSWDVNGDELNGAGVNEPIWPVLTDLYDGKKPILNDQRDIDRFAEECPDLTIHCQNDTVNIPREVEELPIRRRA